MLRAQWSEQNVAAGIVYPTEKVRVTNSGSCLGKNGNSMALISIERITSNFVFCTHEHSYL